MANKIFIQIASYRDPELLPTIKNCIENADQPDNLTFGICWQHATEDLWDNLNDYINDIRFKVISIHYSQTKGCCWGRNKLQQLYDGEEYTLQLDSHHRFIKGWDTILINMFNQLKEKGHEKPLITTYLPSYNPENDPNGRKLVPWKIDLKEITKEKQVLFIPSNIANFSLLTEPISAKFYSAHFAFTTGQFIKEVPHDPHLYFTGEEMSITVRAYTYGYTLFHPHIVIAWHEYTRKNRTKQWDDDKEWWKKDLHSKKHYLQIFSNIDKPYGLGSQRTLQDYISFSGVNFLDINIDKIDKIEEVKEIDKIVDKKYKQLDDAWRNWIDKNIKLGVSKKVISNILLEANFDPDKIDNII
jgi:hypothetical protein